jgi:hypothetical protein
MSISTLPPVFLRLDSGQCRIFYSRSAALRAILHPGPAAQGRICSLAYPALTPSARKRLGPRWANLSSRLTALHYRSDSVVVCLCAEVVP